MARPKKQLAVSNSTASDSAAPLPRLKMGEVGSENESWKDVVGYEGYYKVSNLGRVITLERVVIQPYPRAHLGYRPVVRPEKIMGTSVTRFGREKIILSLNNEKSTFFVHRLVAQAFIPNLENKPEVNHIDGNPLNNSLNNLEWVTKSENIKHAHAIGLIDQYGERNPASKLTNAERLEIYNELNSKPKYRGVLSDLGRKYNVSSGLISLIGKGMHLG